MVFPKAAVVVLKNSGDQHSQLGADKTNCEAYSDSLRADLSMFCVEMTTICQ